MSKIAGFAITGLYFFALASFSASTEGISPTDKKLVSNIPAMVERLKKIPGDRKLQFELGKAFYLDKKYDEALEHLKVANEDPTPDVLKLLAKVYKAKKDDLQVVRAYEILLTSKPNDYVSRVELAEAQFRTNHFDQAIENFKKALKVYPKYREGYAGLLKVYSLRKNTYESRNVALEMERYFPDDLKVLGLICRFYAEDNFYERGIQICGRALARDPENAENMVYLGLMQKGISDGKKGHDILVRAAKKFPKSEFAQITAAQSNDALHNWEAAAFYYRRAINLSPKSGVAWLGLALAEFSGDNFESALKSFLEACKFERKAYGEIVRSTGLLLTKKNEKWYTKYRESQDRCTLEKIHTDR